MTAATAASNLKDHDLVSGGPLQAGRQGVLVVKIMPGLPGDKSGLKTGDIVYLANGRRTRKPQDWLSVMAGRRSGERVEVSGLRDGKPFQWLMSE